MGVKKIYFVFDIREFNYKMVIKVFWIRCSILGKVVKFFEELGGFDVFERVFLGITFC